MATRNSSGVEWQRARMDGNRPRTHIPVLKSNEEQLAKIRRQLEGMFGELRLVQDIIMVCGGVRESISSDLDDEVEHVLRRCGSDRPPLC